MFEEGNWQQVRKDLTPTDTETALNHINVMESATVVHEDHKEEINENLEQRYLELLEQYGGEEDVMQYHDIGAFSTTLAVEKNDEPVFAFDGNEERYSRKTGLMKGLTTLF